MKRVYKETVTQMQKDFKEWANEWLGPICFFVLSIAFIVASIIVVTMLLALTDLPVGGVLLIVLSLAAVEMIGLNWTHTAYTKAKEKVKNENSTLMRQIKYPK